MEAILNDICKKGVMGKTVACVYTIELQKHGLPHMHLIIFFDHTSKFHSPDDVDSLISAEIPCPDTRPELYAAVTKFMIHSPCGSQNQNACCMSDGKCSKNFPKPWCNETTISEDSYASYRRRDNGRFFMTKVGNDEVRVDNRWVVPYCPYLIWRYQCHIHVECTMSIKSIKYIYKYVYKGHDCKTMRFGEVQDEVALYLDACYVSACESCWRIFKFHMHSEYPAVMRLQVHTENQQTITWNAMDEPHIEEILERGAQHDTTLTAWFKANVTYPNAREHLYQDFPQHFVWQQKSHKWTPQKKQFAIGCMYYAHPTSGERFYLRTLLAVVKGATSFENLRTVNGEVQPTFRQACLKLGLLEDDREWHQCLQEASQMQTSHQLRNLFVTILRDCIPNEPDKLWVSYRESICDDLQHALRRKGIPEPTPDQIFDYGLHLMERSLNISGKSRISLLCLSHRQTGIISLETT